MSSKWDTKNYYSIIQGEGFFACGRDKGKERIKKE
jgi:hypothetical protein